jgi:hypothetical protein
MLFTCMAVLSRTVVRRGEHVKCELLGASNKLLGGPGQVGKIQHERTADKGLSQAQERGQDGCIREVLQEIAAQVCTKYA